MLKGGSDLVKKSTVRSINHDAKEHKHVINRWILQYNRLDCNIVKVVRHKPKMHMNTNNKSSTIKSPSTGAGARLYCETPRTQARREFERNQFQSLSISPMKKMDNLNDEENLAKLRKERRRLPGIDSSDIQPDTMISSSILGRNTKKNLSNNKPKAFLFSEYDDNEYDKHCPENDEDEDVDEKEKEARKRIINYLSTNKKHHFSDEEDTELSDDISREERKQKYEESKNKSFEEIVKEDNARRRHEDRLVHRLPDILKQQDLEWSD
jgi:hypothetical protein